MTAETHNTIKRFTAVVAAFGTALTMAAAPVVAQSRGLLGATQGASADAGDFVQDGLKFHRVGGFIQVVDIAKSQSAGTVIFPPNQPPMFAPMPGYDIESAYEKHVKGGGTAVDTNAAANASPASSNVRSAAARVTDIGWNETSHIATLSGGRFVKLIDAENAEVTLPGPAGNKTYQLHFHAAGFGSFMKEWAHREQGRVGGSLGGGGVTITLAGDGGMPGGQVYDTAGGTVYGSSGFQQAKAVISTVDDAMQFAPSLGEAKVVKSLLSNNLGLK